MTVLLIYGPVLLNYGPILLRIDLILLRIDLNIDLQTDLPHASLLVVPPDTVSVIIS